MSEALQDLVDHEEDRIAREAASGQKSKGRSLPHMRLVGPPGTGKSTTARKVAAVLHELGMTANEKVVSTKASDLSGEYQGQTEEKMRQLMKDAKGGVLVIDEAHQLASTDYGKIALKSLIEPMANPDLKTVVMFAGYEKDMKDLEKVDPGFKERVPRTLSFAAFDAEQMTDFTLGLVEDTPGLSLDSKSEEAVTRVMAKVAETDHASMRTAGNLLDAANKARIAREKEARRKMPAADRGVLTRADWVSAWKDYEESR